jgi:hypothetical protein
VAQTQMEGHCRLAPVGDLTLNVMARIVPVTSVLLGVTLMLCRFRVFPLDQDPDGWNSLLVILGLGAFAILWSVVGLRQNTLNGIPVYGPLGLFALPIVCFFSYSGNVILTVAASAAFCLVLIRSLYEIVHA